MRILTQKEKDCISTEPRRKGKWRLKTRECGSKEGIRRRAQKKKRSATRNGTGNENFATAGRIWRGIGKTLRRENPKTRKRIEAPEI